MLYEYGYANKELPQFKVFNISVYGNAKIKLNNHYFKLYVNWKEKKVILRIYDKNLKIVDELTSWSFEILQEKLERKLKKLAFIHAERKFSHNKVYFKYTDIKFYQLSSFERFLKLIELGMIHVTFRIGVYTTKRKWGDIHDHGTSFSINEQDLERLFDRIYL